MQGERMTKNVKDAIHEKSQAEFRLELMDMSRCPECGKIQSIPREAGDDCENEDCECYVVKARKYNYWTNPNWG